jgi:uncharacterized protein (TIGR03435 family)
MTCRLNLGFSLIAVATSLSVAVSAQKPAFDVASVKTNQSGVTRWRVGADGTRDNITRFVATNATLRRLIRYAYSHLRQNEIVGGPGWIDTARFDVEAKPDTAAGATPFEEIQLMVRTLLEDRFALKAHLETRQLPVFHLMIASKDRLQIKASDDQTPPPPPVAVTSIDEPLPRGTAFIRAERDGQIVVGKAVPISSLVNFLQEQTDRRLFDRTGLKGLFDFEVRFTPEVTTSSTLPADSAFPSLSTAIQEQLGLKLEPARGPVDVLVIDSVRRPIEN